MSNKFYRFFQTLARGKDGQGGSIAVTGLQRASMQNILLIGADAAVFSNGTIKFGFNLQRQFAIEQNKLLAELKVFKELLRTAFYRDYQKAKNERGCR